ncbi:MAG: CgeB family protein [Phycisphaerae bacterium]
MKLVIFGLTVSSSWGNGHATLWRSLIRALGRMGHEVVFFEKDVPYYAAHRDLLALERGQLVLYPTWDAVREIAQQHLDDADVGMATSYCPDGPTASELVLESGARVKAFYDLDTPVTLDRVSAGERVDYLPEGGLGAFDIVLSFTGGKALGALQRVLGARRVAALYGSVDSAVHRPVPANEAFRADLSYLGTFAADRQRALQQLFIDAARRTPERRFVLAGAQYPEAFPWTDNIYFVRHLPPGDHPSFFAASRLTLNVTRRAMAEYGHCPSGRLFEAAACGCPVLSDTWEGLDEFFAPGREIVLARTTEDAMAAVEMTDAELRRIAQAARDRVMAAHTGEMRAHEMFALLQNARATIPALRATAGVAGGVMDEGSEACGV